MRKPKSKSKKIFLAIIIPSVGIMMVLAPILSNKLGLKKSVGEPKFTLASNDKTMELRVYSTLSLSIAAHEVTVYLVKNGVQNKRPLYTQLYCANVELKWISSTEILINTHKQTLRDIKEIKSNEAYCPSTTKKAE